MQYVALVLSMYFAANLGIAAIAKIEQPNTFATVLRRNDVLPEWGVRGVCRYFPWLEITMAVLLVTGTVPVMTAVLTVCLFATFLIVKGRMLVTHRVSDCGCFGAASTQPLNKAGLATSSLFLMLTLVYLWLVLKVGIVPWQWRTGASVVFATIEGGLGWLAWKRYKWNSRCRIWANAGGCTSTSQPRLTLPDAAIARMD